MKMSTTERKQAMTDMWLECNSHDGLTKTRVRCLVGAAWWALSTFCAFWALMATAAAMGARPDGSLILTFIVKLYAMLLVIDPQAPLFWACSICTALYAGVVGASVAIRLRWMDIRRARTYRSIPGG